VRVRISRGFLASGLGLAMLGTFLALILIGAGVLGYYWYSYGRMIDEHLAGHVNQTTARIYAGPTRISVGEPLAASEIVSKLQLAGYGAAEVPGAPGWYSVQGDAVEIHPESASYFAGKNALRVEFNGRSIRAIRALDDGSSPGNAEIEPQLITNLFDSSREKRRKVRFEDIPKVLEEALLSAEDKRFFEHPGFDVVRMLGAAWADLRHDAKAQGASTLTMQLSRSFFFSTERTWRRKVAETIVSLELEHRFTKQQIFELYANEIYLGNRGSFGIHGFAEGSLAYFNKDIHDLSLSEAAFLAGIIRAPNRYSSADRRPERAAEARDRVLNQMATNGYITPEQAREAKRIPLRLAPAGLESSDAPFFVDMVKDHLLDQFSEEELLSQSFRVYTTLDPELQRAATQAMSIGIANIDQQLARRYARWQKQGQPVTAQVAMVVLDPHTGEIRALIGGRDYGQSQLNHILARRQPGSAFKPFVYAAAFDNALKGLTPVVTPATTVVDEPTTFDFDGKEYTPNNYGENFHGTVSTRDALTYSLNIATIKVAELIGYGRVVDMARQLGLDPGIQATPAVALGAYEMTPLDVAAGYTVFANGGVRAEPMFIDRVTSAEGKAIETNAVKTREALDPRVAYLVTNILEDVIDHGTGASVRARGFAGPAAGKTGSSRDGWFAGYTSNLLCIVWVGFDDNRDLNLVGGVSAAPIWAEFMKRATAMAAYHDLQDFSPPEGVTEVELDPQTLLLATPTCPAKRKEVFIAGTEPTEFCDKGGGLLTQTPPASWLSRLFGGDKAKAAEDSSAEPPAAGPSATKAPAQAGKPAAESATPPESPEADRKKGLFHRIFGIFGGNKADQEQPQKSSPN
jgi:penicillin-binding protein 1B